MRFLSRLRAPCCAIALMTIPCAAYSAETVSCDVEAVDGADARLWAKGRWRELEPGANIPRDAIVVTGDDTRAKIACSDGLVLTVGLATEINLESVADRDQGRVAQLIRGVLGVLSPRRIRESLTVRTPVATAAVGPARTLVEASPKGGAAVFVREGSVNVSAADGSLARLGPGEGVTVDASGVAGPVKVWGAARIETSMGALGFDWR